MCVRYSESRCVHFQIKSPFEKVVLHTTIIQVGRESLNFWRLSHHLVSLVYTHTHTTQVQTWPVDLFLHHSFCWFIFIFGCKCNTLPPSLASTPHTHGQTMWVNLIIFAPILWCLSTWLIRLLLWIKWIIWCSNKFRHAKQKKKQLLI